MHDRRNSHASAVTRFEASIETVRDRFRRFPWSFRLSYVHVGCGSCTDNQLPPTTVDHRIVVVQRLKFLNIDACLLFKSLLQFLIKLQDVHGLEKQIASVDQDIATSTVASDRTVRPRPMSPQNRYVFSAGPSITSVYFCLIDCPRS